MTWKYDQGSGNLTHDGEMIAKGYSGIDPHKNVPADQNLPFLGPLPQGTYTIGQPISVRQALSSEVSSGPTR